MKTVIKALLAATALLPAGAIAQDANWQGRAEMRANRGGDRGGDRSGDRSGDGQQRGQRGPQVAADLNVQRDADRQDRPQRDGSQRGQWRGQANTQVDAPRPATAYQQPQQVAPQDIQRNQYRDRRDDRGNPGYRGDRTDGGYRGDRPDRADRLDRPDRADRYANGAAAVRRYQDDRGDIARGRQDRPTWQDDRGAAQRYGYRNDGRQGTNRGVWSRDWRGDNRYNYTSYRTANRGAYRLPRYYAPSGWGQGYRRFGIGVTLSSFLWDQNYWIQDPYSYRLPDAYGPYRWVRYYDDALLVDIRTGRIVDSVYGIFY